MQETFVSYNRADRAAAKRVRDLLSGHGLTSFLDVDSLPPGKPWQPEIEQAIGRCPATLVLIGPQGLGNTQKREIAVAIDLQSHDPDRFVVPIVLEGAADPPLGFLSQNTWVDMRHGVDEVAEVERLAGWLKPGAKKTAPGTVVRSIDVCPYRGLLPFREEDAAFFMGRDLETDELEQKVRKRPLVGVVGASGSGKSSLVRAGLASRLRASPGSDVWQIATIVPSDGPLKALSEAVVSVMEPGLESLDRVKKIGEVARNLDQGPITLEDYVKEALARDPSTTHILLIVDQWEELYALNEKRDVHNRFIEQIRSACKVPRFRCVFTVRGDFYGRVLESDFLVETLRDAEVKLGRVSPGGLHAMIEEPARKLELRFEEGLVDRILTDTGDEPGNLPLLEFVLTRLWEHCRARGVLTHDAYKKLGCVSGALAAHAQGFLEDRPRAEAGMRRILTRLVQAGDGGPATRRKRSLASFTAEDVELVKELADHRLLVTAKTEDQQAETVEMAHEALIEGWTTLQEWITQDRAFLAWNERLRGDRESGQLLSGDLLAVARDWLDQRRDALNPDEIDFIERSVRRARSKYWAVISVTAVVIAALAIFLYVALDAKRRMEEDSAWPVVTDLLERSASHPGLYSDTTIDERDKWLDDAGKVMDRLPAFRTLEVKLEPGSSRRERLGEVLARESTLRSHYQAIHEAKDRWSIAAETAGVASLAPQEGLVPLGRDEASRLWEFLVAGTGSVPEWRGELDAGRAQPDSETGIVLVLVPAGVLHQGGAEVELRAFLLAKYEVTRTQWSRLCGGRPVADGRLPQAGVPWIDCVDGLRPWGLTLPTEAQWEYACRAETKSEWWTGSELDSLAHAANLTWKDGETASGLRLADTYHNVAPVGSLRANSFGLHDVHGNVSEWCLDAFDEYGDAGAPRGIDGLRTPEREHFRVMRGGSFLSTPDYARSGRRNHNSPSFAGGEIGFRVARALVD